MVFNMLYIVFVMKLCVIDFIYDYEVVVKMDFGKVRDIVDKWNIFYKVCIIIDVFILVWCVYNFVYN